MNRSQKYISILLERLPKWELRSYEHQTNLDRIRDRISSTSDVTKELETLYRVKGFSDFALTLLWIADKVEKDASLEESTIAEETFVFAKFRKAMGDNTVTEEELDPAKLREVPQIPEEPPPPSVPTPEVLLDSTWNPEAQPRMEQQPAAGSPPAGREHERAFAALLEKFLEAVQSGSDDRLALMSNLLNECSTAILSPSAVPEYKSFCQMLVEFLQYISDNQFLDDVRVMNIVSNIQDPIAQWAVSEEANRAGLLDQAIDILRDFKTMFE
jgi:hypothetical protein